MIIPKYVQEIMARATFELGYHKKDYEPGYTIRIRKATQYTRIETLEAECERLIKWAQRNGATESRIDSDLSSVATQYAWQYAIVTIYDPCMKYLEAFMPRKEFENSIALACGHIFGDVSRLDRPTVHISEVDYPAVYDGCQP